MDLELDRPRRDQRDIEYARWVLDAKVRSLTALCSFQSSGKGDDRSRKAIYDLADQIVALSPDSASPVTTEKS